MSTLPDAEAPALRLDPSGDAFFDVLQPLIVAKPQQALDASIAARELAESTGNEAGVVRALLGQGMAHDALGQSQRDAVLAEALGRAQSLGDPLLLLRATNSRVVVDIYHGRYADALSLGQSILGLAHALGRNDLLGRLLNNLATASGLIGEFSTCIAIYAEWNALLVGDSDATRLNRILAANNEGEAWLRLSFSLAREGQAASAEAAIGRARRLSLHACEQMQRESHVGLRLSALDTLVSVLLAQQDTELARQWIDKVGAVSGDQLEAGSVHWGMWTLIQARVELARGDADVQGALAKLRAVEALPGPRFRGGEMQAMLHVSLTDALERLGQHREALHYHRQSLRFEARTQSLLAREHAMAVHHTLDTLRGETEEFITHDLRNPLGAALVQLEAAEAATRSDTARHVIRHSWDGVRRTVDTADQYLTMVRVRQLRRAELKLIDLAELVDDVGERLAPPAGAGVRLDRQIEWGMDIKGDRISLLAALDTLLREALRTVPQGGMVRWCLRAEPGYAVLEVDGGDMRGLAEWASMRPAASLPVAAAMLSRVAQLHDSRLDIDLQGGDAVSTVAWWIPRAGA